jgi:hypothetical protein
MQLGAWRLGVSVRVAHPKSSRFSRRANRQNTKVLHMPVGYRSTLVEEVGFELSFWTTARLIHGLSRYFLEVSNFRKP